MEAKKKRMQELVELLNRARRAYEQEDTEIMSNYEYDRLYDELEGLERELGTTLASSPTVNVGYEVLSELPKERHEKPMLSLDKTKDVEQLKSFLGEQKAVISWKMDGLTIVLTYQNGRLQSSHKRKRRGGRSHHQQCEGISQSSSSDPVSGRTDPAWGGRDRI